MNWLIKKLVDSDWVRLGLAFRWIFGTKFVLKALINDADLNVIEKRYNSMKENGFFSGKNAAFRQQSFIQVFFFSGPGQENAFTKALGLYSFKEKNSPTPLHHYYSLLNAVSFKAPMLKLIKKS